MFAIPIVLLFIAFAIIPYTSKEQCESDIVPCGVESRNVMNALKVNAFAMRYQLTKN
jgi:hypothetical protein